MHQEKQNTPGKAPIVITSTLGLAMLLASFGTSIANIALPTLAETFDAQFSQVQPVVVVYLLTLTVSVVLVGRLGDRWGMTRMLRLGIGLFLTATLLSGLSPSLPLLIAARAMQGIGAAFMMTLSMALMRHNVGESHIGRAMGLLGTMSAIGTALGPSLGGLLIPFGGWRGIFWAQVPLAAITLLLAHFHLPNDYHRSRLGAPSLMSAFTLSLAGSLISNLLVAAVMMATLIVGPFYLGIVLGLEPMLVGLVMAIGPAISIIFGVPSGHLVDAWGSRHVVVIGVVLVGAGACLLALLPDVMGIAGYVAALVVLTPGYQLFQAANNTQALSTVPKEQRGTTSGLLNLSRNIGLVAGASVMGSIFAFGVGTADFIHAAPLQIAAGMRVTFLLSGLLMVAALAIVSSAVMRNDRSG